MSGLEAVAEGVGIPFVIAFVLFGVSCLLLLPIVVPFIQRTTNILSRKSWKKSNDKVVRELEERYAKEEAD